MKKTTEPETVVIFRTERDGEIIAFFPEHLGSYEPWSCTVYAHIGQHMNAHVAYYKTTRPAKNYADLYHELTRLVGYRLKVVKRWTRRHDRARLTTFKP